MVEGDDLKPWSLRHRAVPWRSIAGVGAGALVGSFFIGTGDIVVATEMGSRFGFGMWWTFPVLGVAGWTMMDMSVRYFLRFGRTPLSMFKEVHPAFSVYLVLTVVVTTTIGAHSQWNACAHVASTFFPEIPSELGGGASALLALLVLVFGVYRRIELFFIGCLILLVVLFLLAAIAAGAQWSEAPAGLLPGLPEAERGRWFELIQQNAGSLINAWLILIYPYTMLEKGWHSRRAAEQARILQRVRWDYGIGIAAAGIVALPIMAAAMAVAMPFGIVPRNGTEFAALLEPLAGGAARAVFLSGLFVAAWTAGIGWMVCGAYALLDLGNIELKLQSRPFRRALAVFTVASASILFLRVNPIYGIKVFMIFLAAVFPVVALVMVWRVSRPDMGYFRWWPWSVRGLVVISLDVFALAVSLLVGWGMASGLIG